METKSEIQPYADREKTPEDHQAERHLKSAFRLTESLNALMTQMRGKDTHAQLWPVQAIIDEIEVNLCFAVSNYCAPSSEQMKQEIAERRKWREVEWAKIQAEDKQLAN